MHSTSDNHIPVTLLSGDVLLILYLHLYCTQLVYILIAVICLTHSPSCAWEHWSCEVVHMVGWGDTLTCMYM